MIFNDLEHQRQSVTDISYIGLCWEVCITSIQDRFITKYIPVGLNSSSKLWEGLTISSLSAQTVPIGLQDESTSNERKKNLYFVPKITLDLETTRNRSYGRHGLT